MEVLTFTFIIVSLLLILVLYNQLPDKIPIHFNWPTKDINGLGTKDLLWASPLICGVIGYVIYRLTGYPWKFKNLTWTKDKNARYNYKQTMQMLRILNLLIAILCLWATLISILGGLGIQTEMARYADPFFFISLTGIPLFYVVKILVKKIR